MPQQNGPPAEASLSPVWHPQVQQWNEQIVRYAERHHIDPDLVAALVWHESQGISWEESAAGAIGLMQVMSSDVGFVHRPNAEQLLKASTNLYWGTAILSDIIKQAKGDIFTSLAAYNGGWYQTDLNIPREYAEDVMLNYARAVAVRNGYTDPALEEWGLVIELQGRTDVDFATSPRPGWLLTSHISGPRPVAGRPVIGAVVYSSIDQQGSPWRITMWLLPNE